MSLAILFHFLCTQHVSDINICIIRSFRLCCWITTSVVLFSVRCVLEIWCGWVSVVVLQPATRALLKPSRTKSPNTQRTDNKTTDVVIQQYSRKLLMMAILMSETCWVHKKWHKIASAIKLVFYTSTFIPLFTLKTVPRPGFYILPYILDFLSIFTDWKKCFRLLSEIELSGWATELRTRRKKILSYLAKRRSKVGIFIWIFEKKHWVKGS